MGWSLHYLSLCFSQALAGHKHIITLYSCKQPKLVQKSLIVYKWWVRFYYTIIRSTFVIKQKNIKKNIIVSVIVLFRISIQLVFIWGVMWQLFKLTIAILENQNINIAICKHIKYYKWLLDRTYVHIAANYTCQ